ncbi:MAG: phosphatidylinositol-specific phospholipase C domain-containing protein [Clostridia bacterium]|nr:phosphatidylinositol-specific phospholipase C domain-containing protein [Clostridia bacterium]
MNKWMKNLSNDIKISEINLPGTHNSCAKRVQFSYLSKCHNLSIYEQLNIGIRYLDIRVEIYGNKLKTVHSIADCYTPHGKRQKLLLDYVLDDCKKFLKENPSETIVLCIKRDDGPSSEETFDLLFENYIKNDPSWFTENRIPSLGEARGKLVFFNRCHVDSNNKKYTDKNTGLHLSNWPDLPRDAACFLAKAPALNLDNAEAEAYYLQDMYKLFPKEKWQKAVLPLVEKPFEKQGLFLNYFTAANFIYSPKIYANFILKNFEKITLQNNKKYGWLIFDFPTKDLCEKVISTNL